MSCLDDAAGIVAWPGEDYFATVLRAYLKLGRARTGRVGAAVAELIDAADLLGHAVTWMTRHLGGHGGPGGGRQGGGPGGGLGGGRCRA